MLDKYSPNLLGVDASGNAMLWPGRLNINVLTSAESEGVSSSDKRKWGWSLYMYRYHFLFVSISAWIGKEARERFWYAARALFELMLL